MSSGKLFCLAILLIVVAVLPWVLRSDYYIHLMIMVGMNAVLTMTFVLLLRVGLVSLGIAAFWGVGAYTAALLAGKAELSMWLALPASVVTTGMVALVVGFILIRSGGFGFVMLSALVGMVTVLVFGTFQFFGGYVGITNIMPPEPIHLPFLGMVEFVSKVPYYYLLLLLLIVVVTVFQAFYSAWTGRAWKAIELSPLLAKSLGISVFGYRLSAFVIASMAAGLMGWFYVAYFGSVAPATFDMFKTFNVQIYAILGGLSSAFVGPVIGTFVMTAAPEYLRIAREIEPIATGLLLIVLVLFFPDGLISLTRSSRFRGDGFLGIGKVGLRLRRLLSVQRDR